MKKALVLLSGGQDSTTCLAMAQEKYTHIEGLFIHYGQRHAIEFEMAKTVAKKANIQLHKIRTDLFTHLTQNALTSTDIAIEQNEGELPSTFVPGRNHIFLSIAGIMAQQKGITSLVTGVCQTDYSGYPDCRNDFIQSLNQTLNLAMDTNLVIDTPLMFLTKAETVLAMEKLGKLDWYADTHTCYEGIRPGCTTCPACVLRANGFEEAGIKDPLFIKN